ncbi:hypothetical protein OAK19_06600 [Aureispira]|nr:hypothetical protein [Aureispira sp.]
MKHLTLIMVTFFMVSVLSSCGSIGHTKRKGCNGKGWYGNRNLSNIDKLKKEHRHKYVWVSEHMQTEEI